jgi:hypothetical protein
MKKFYNVPTDLYIHKNDLIRMEQGEAAVGYEEVSNHENYELISKHAFQPLREQDILSHNSYSVVFIFE